MKQELGSPDAPGSDLGRLLREARPEPELPPGFQAAVWRRVERAEEAQVDSAVVSPGNWWRWLVPQPRLMLALASIVLLVGATLGMRQGTQDAHLAAKARYVAAVSPVQFH